MKKNRDDADDHGTKEAEGKKMTIDDAIYCMRTYLPPLADDGMVCAEGCPFYGSVKVDQQLNVCKADEAHRMAIVALEDQLERENKDCETCSTLERGDKLYQSVDWDNGIGYEYIWDIKYCPVCGKKLAERYRKTRDEAVKKGTCEGGGSNDD